MIIKLVKKDFLRITMLLVAVCIFAAGAVFPLEAEAEGPEPGHSLFIQNFFAYDKALTNDKLRSIYSSGAWTLKTDVNSGRQSEYAIDFKAVNTKKSQLTLSLLGSVEKTIDDEPHEGIYDFSVYYIRQLGKLPVLGKSALRLYQYTSLTKGMGSEQKYRVAVFSGNIDIIYQLMRERDGELRSQYYMTYHNSLASISIGKAVGDHKWTAFLATKKAPVWHASLWDYYTDTKTLWGITYSAFKNGDPVFYNQVEADLTAWQFILGDKEVNLPIFPSFLAFGDIGHGMEITNSPGELRMSNQVGIRFAGRFGVGGGVLLKQFKPGPVKLSPIVSFSAQFPIRKQTFFIEGKYEDKVLSFMVYLQVRF